MDEQPRRRVRYDNGNTRDQNRRKETVDWDQMLLETGMDQWDVTLREDMKAHLEWVRDTRREQMERSRRAPARRYITLTLLGFAVTLLTGLGAFLGAEAAGGSHVSSLGCPSGYVCVPASPSPTGGP